LKKNCPAAHHPCILQIAVFPQTNFWPLWQFSIARFLPCALALILAVTGATVKADDSPFVVDSWSVEEGLPDNEAISVLQGSDGYLWIGTQHGLVRFDGNRFTVFNQMNTPGLISDRIIFLFQDKETNLWIGTESSGLQMIKNGAIQNFSAATSGGGRVSYAAEIAAGDLVFYTASGLIRYHANSVNYYPVSPRLAQLYQQLASLAQRIIIPSLSGGYWQIFNNNVSKMNGGHVEKNLGTFPWGNAAVDAAIEDGKGNLIVGTLGAGIFWSDADGKWQNISNQLSKPYILSLCMDNEGNLWAGTDGGGLDRIKRKLFTTPLGLPVRNIQSISPDAHGGAWVAYGALGAAYWNGDTTRDFQVGPFHNAREVLVDGHQRVWAGTDAEGLYQFKTNEFVPADGALILGPQIFSMFEDHGGQLWVGSQNGLGHFDGQKWALLTTHDGLSGNSVRAMAEDDKDGLWIGTEGQGLDLYQNGKFTYYRAGQENLPGDDISCLCIGSDGNLWVGTFAHGLARFADGKWESFSAQDGLASDSISYIVDDGDMLWLGSNKGLMHVAKKSLEDFAAGKADAILCRTYGKTDGLPTRECSIGSQPAACRAADGHFWFPTTEGVACIDPAELKPNLRPPTVMIESILVNGLEQNTNRLASTWPAIVTITPGVNRSELPLEIHYTALDFSAPGLIRFRYQLEGYQSRWTDAGSDRVARYPKLPPGNYRFNVVAYNEDGVSNENSGSFTVIVLPQFWQTTWFAVLVIIITLGIVAAIVRYISTQKLHRQLQRHKQQEALERERARIARDLHDQLGANLTQVTLLGEMAEADKNVPEEIESHAQQICETARETTRALDEIVWAINPANDTLEGVANYCIKYAQEFFALAGVRCRVEAPARLPDVPIAPDVRHNVFLAFKESVNNVIKHAQAGEAHIHLELTARHFIVEITDNGKGFSGADEKQNRNGLRNMRKRMADIGGSFEISPAPEKGTLVRLTVPIRNNG
jgi:signal transduction histidine kinase/ligand-binding sensor domain-containing protein